MGRLEFPRTILEFQARFGDEQACWDYLFQCRWPEGFVCPRCKGGGAWPIVARKLRGCAGCHYQVPLTAGTVLQKTHTPLHLWFWAAYLMTTGTRGISASQLQRQLGLTRHKTAWTMLHKLRRAMVNPERTLLAGEVEVDECQVGGHEAGRRGDRSSIAKAALVAVAVEVRDKGSGRLRMKVIPDASGGDPQRFHGWPPSRPAPPCTPTTGWATRPWPSKVTTTGHDHNEPPKGSATPTR